MKLRTCSPRVSRRKLQMFPVSHLPESEISSLANEEVLTKDQGEPNVVSSRLGGGAGVHYQGTVATSMVDILDSSERKEEMEGLWRQSAHLYTLSSRITRLVRRSGRTRVSMAKLSQSSHARWPDIVRFTLSPWNGLWRPTAARFMDQN